MRDTERDTSVGLTMNPHLVRILVVEDETLQREMLAGHLLQRGYEVFQASSAELALQELQAHRIDVVLADFRLPGISGLDLVEAGRRINPEIGFVMMTAYATIEIAVQAMKSGTIDFITKPIELDALDAVLERVAQERQLVAENQRLRRRLAQVDCDTEFLGTSFEIRKVLDTASRVAPLDTTVLITGETGSGKEMLANVIQSLSRRSEGSFVKVNCGAIPHELFESELFGHRRGSFTGADRDRAGRLAEADGGTLMLDEIGEMPLAAQVKLLRVLQGEKYFPVGSDQAKSSNVRVIACTNRDLGSMIAEGRFREDLYFRLNVVQIEIPPLRARREDIGVFLDHFLEKLAVRVGVHARKLSSSARDALMKYDWPGNARQVRNVVERALLLTRGPVIDLTDLPLEVVAARPVTTSSLESPVDLETAVSQLEESYLRKALELARGNQTKAAEVLGISERTLRYKLNKYGIRRGSHK